MINLNGIEEQLSIEQDFFLLLCFSSRTGLSICFRNRRVFEYQENCDVSSKNSRQRVNQRKQVGGISVEADCYTIRSHCRKQRRRKTQILIELQLISPFEDCPDRGVLLRQPSLVILLSHFWRWRGNSTLHSLSSPTSSPYSHTNADKALRGESASSRRFAVSFLPPEAPSQAALLPPISFPLGHSSFLRPPVCSVNGSGDCSVNCSGDCSVNESVSGSIDCSFNGSVDCSFDFPFSRLRWRSCRFSLIAAANSRSTSSVRHFVTSHPRMML